MTQNEQAIANTLEIFRQSPGKLFKVDEIEKMVNFDHSLDFSEVVKTLTFLENEKKIVSDKHGQFKLAQEDQLLEGSFRANDKGFGFIHLEEEDEQDIFVAKGNTLFALDGDTVTVKIIKGANPWNGRGPEGIVTEVLEHKVTSLVGEFMPYSDVMVKKTGYYGYVKSHNKKLKNYSVFISEDGIHPQMGDMVKVDITQYPSAVFPTRMLGVALFTIGNKNDPGVDIMSVVYDHDIKTEFDPEALEQSEAIPDHVLPEEKAARRDLTEEVTVTIDGDDSKDFDDAVTLWKLPNGNYHLGVHIADVSHYVTEGSPLDQEAFERSNSTYLVDRVIPMLPFRLSNGICSLNPDVERLTLSCDMEITPSGERVSYDIFQSVIKSHARLTYNSVNKVLDPENTEVLEPKYEELRPMLEEMGKLHEALYQKRHARGAIDFEENEAKIIVDENGHPTDIELRQRGIAERMIESFMLMANETVAEHYRKEHVPFLYRVHETPDEERIKNFFDFIGAFGLNIKADPADVKPLDLQRVVTAVEGTPEEAVVSTVLLRSLKQAKYAPDALGHFGLAAVDYTHFTSPIRRYADLTVHRMIHDYSEKGETEEIKQHFNVRLEDIADQVSKQERRSIDTEREVDVLKKTEFMMDKVGQHFNATVSSVTSFGMFIALPNTVEGLIHISNLTDDYYQFDEKQMTMTGKNTHKVFKIGMPIKVTLINADLNQKQIDFELYDPNAPAKPKPTGFSRPRGGAQVNNNRANGKDGNGPRRQNRGQNRSNRRHESNNGHK
ncbi:ribonuclease R [Amylolactobacillus amylotrophicus DSM 20534]|uniref:Ribonuclease R n=3 Tax=Amylolactobacillus TaxID=2767876 RepID=A0A0R1YJD3_9LACO|nr:MULTISPECIES: ribonuclease R [Amylolactobacillus]APT18974.1 ribonuclease R [Amylolactobacillus amylophilus DSM 20533 = JCM 1125]KRK38765.1 ribonuclease R [Amylolactobacillus amylotrophicus DSM 20534]KRM42592.1 ribonuclease R [Amylolactobacillus amylophilus DSM 20533 = JCM 1125]GED79985.1 ribonuclease R [Amylolactobacillus amylophilus]